MKIYEDLLVLINEVSDELAQRVKEKRRDNWSKAFRLKGLVNSDTYQNEIDWNRKNGRPDKAEEMEKAREKANAEAIEATQKSQRNDYLMDQRRERKAKERKKLEEFKEKLLNKKQTPQETQKAGSDHANAMIDQGLRNKLEKVFSHECLEEICALVEEFINEAQCCPSYVDKDGATQFQLFNTGLTGRNLQQENKPQPKVAKVKNPNRVEGGKKGHQTRLENAKKEFANRSIFKALGYDPFNNGGENG